MTKEKDLRKKQIKTICQHIRRYVIKVKEAFELIEEISQHPGTNAYGVKKEKI